MSAALYAGLGILQLASGYFAAENMEKTAALNRKIAEANAEFAELDAYDAELDGISQVARYQSVIDRTLSDQRTILAAKDVDINYGSVASIPDESRLIAEMNKMEIQKRARERALGFQNQARDIILSGELGVIQARANARAAKFKAFTGAASTGISGYRAYKQDGSFF